MTWNSSHIMTVAVLAGAAVAAICGAAAIQANADAVVIALVTVIAALIAAGSTWAIGEQKRRVQMAEKRRRIRSSLYLEITGYLNRGMNPHALLAQAYKSGTIIPDNITHIMLRGALEMPEPVYFPANFDKLAHLDNPEAVIAFYNCLDVVRRQRGRPGMESVFDAPNTVQISHIIVPLGMMLKVGVDLLESPEFAEIQPIPRAQFIRGLRTSLAASPRPFKSAADLKPQSSGVAGVRRTSG